MKASEFLKYFFIDADGGNLRLLDKACSYWGLNGDDLERCVERAERYHRTDLVSVKKILGVYIAEWMSPFDSRWNRRIYYNVPGTITWMYWLKELAGEKTYAGSPDYISMVVLYGLFGKSERIDTGNCRHCAVNLMRSKLTMDPGYPAADIQISFGFTCDEAPKQDALIAESQNDRRLTRYAVANPMRGGNDREYILGMLNEAASGIRKMSSRNMKAEEERKLYLDLKSARFRLAARIHALIDSVSRCEEFRLTNNDIAFLESLLITSYSCGMARLEELLAELQAEVRVTSGRAVRNRFCVYFTPICNPEYGAIMESNGIALLDHTAFSNSAICTGIKDPCEDAASEGLGMLIAGSGEAEGRKIADIIKRKKMDGFVSGMFAFDRWMGMQQHQLQTIIEEETGKTVFFFDTDFWNQESFSEERMNTAVETLTHMLGEVK